MMCISHRNIIQPVIEKFLLNDMKMKDIHAFSSMFSLRIGNPYPKYFALFSFRNGKFTRGLK
ncbi:hypothetical protein CGK76_00335 [Erysipelotrichaceae bacterium 7770_A6]|nr:hypothetical protein [Erysipelotrichaceae bacterium 7770_A6]